MATKKPLPEYQRRAPAKLNWQALDDYLAATPQQQEVVEEPGFLRSAADSALALGTGGVTGVKLLSDAAGADNAVSRRLGDAVQGMQGLLSPYRQAELANRQRLIEEAEASGSTMQEVGAYLGALREAPLDTMLNAAGTAVPTMAAMAVPGLREARLASMAAGGLGAVQGAGAAKSSIYETVKAEALKEGRSLQEAEALAAQAQAYGGKNDGQIALGAGLGGVAGATGAEKAVRGLVRGGTSAPEGLVRRVATGAAAEAIPEAAQGGQEQLAGNLAAQRENFPVPTMRGVVGSAALEGAAGGALGGTLSIPAVEPLPERGPLTRAANAGIATGAIQPPLPPPAEPPPEVADALRETANQRAAELEEKVKGVKETKGPDGEVIPGTPKQFLTPEEKEEQAFLQENGGDAAALAERYGIAPQAAPVNESEPTPAAAATLPEDEALAAPVQTPLPAGDPVAQREADRPPEPTGEVLPGDLLNPQGRPFLNITAANRAQKAAGEGYSIVRVADGLVVRPIQQEVPDGSVAVAADGRAAGSGAGGLADETGSLAAVGRVPGEPMAAVSAGAPAAAAAPSDAALAGPPDDAAVAPAIEAAANEAATSPANELPEPTEAQKKAGNYKLGHATWNGLSLSFENPKGSERKGVDRGGKPWSVTMPAHYGYVRRTEGADGDHVDIYMGDRPESEQVFIVDQVDADTGKWDEHKVILGTASREEALALYDAGFSDGKGPQRRQGVTATTLDDFKTWLREGDTKKPFAPTSAGAPATVAEALRDESDDITLPGAPAPATDDQNQPQGPAPTPAVEAPAPAQGPAAGPAGADELPAAGGDAAQAAGVAAPADEDRSSEGAGAAGRADAQQERAAPNREDAGSTVPAGPRQPAAAAATNSERPTELIALRKRLSTLNALKACLQ